MRRSIALGLTAVLLPASGLEAQDSLCNPCVDAPVRPRLSAPEALGSPGNTVIVTAEDMRGLGVISVADMVRQLPSAGGFSELPRTPQGFGTRHFDLRGDHAALGLPAAELGALLDEVYAYVSERVGVSVAGLIPVTVSPAVAAACPPRGRASRDEIELFADASWSREQLLGVFAHELGHVLQFRGIPGISRLGGQFMQGYASWAAGRYWFDWQGYDSLHAAVGDYLERDRFLPLSTPFEVVFEAGPDAGGASDCIERRDIILSEWASLFDYLVESHGRDEVYARAEAAPAPGADGVDYRAIFGRSFAQIEAGWLEAVRAQR